VSEFEPSATRRLVPASVVVQSVVLPEQVWVIEKSPVIVNIGEPVSVKVRFTEKVAENEVSKLPVSPVTLTVPLSVSSAISVQLLKVTVPAVGLAMSVVADPPNEQMTVVAAPTTV
jgi:hypothetical protein